MGRRCWPACCPASAVGLFYTALYVRVGVPSFVITLAGLLGFQGLLLYVLGKDGTINIPDDSGLVQFARYSFVKGPVAYALVLVVVALYVIAHLIGMRRRKAAGLSAPSVAGLADPRRACSLPACCS